MGWAPHLVAEMAANQHDAALHVAPGFIGAALGHHARLVHLACASTRVNLATAVPVGVA